MKVFISVFGKFHAFDQAKELNKKNCLHKIFTTYPKYMVRKYGIRDDQIISFPIFEILSRIRILIPQQFINSYLKYISILFDYTCSLYITKDINFFIGWSGFSKISLLKSKKLNIRTMLERGSASIDYQKKILQKEAKKLKIKFNFPDYFVHKELTEYEIADCINVPSQFSKKTFNKKFKKKVFVNKYGADTSFFKFNNKNIKEFIIIYVGGFSYQKGSHYLLKAIYKMSANYNIKFWHVGQIENNLKPLINKYSNSKMIFYGHKSFNKIPGYFSKASIFCIPSIHDGLALVIPQALSSGLPVICTENSGGKEYVINKFNGFIIKPYSTKEIIEKIKILYEDPSALYNMKKNIKKFKIKNLSWKNYGEKLYQKIKNQLKA